MAFFPLDVSLLIQVASLNLAMQHHHEALYDISRALFIQPHKIECLMLKHKILRALLLAASPDKPLDADHLQSLVRNADTFISWASKNHPMRPELLYDVVKLKHLASGKINNYYLYMASISLAFQVRCFTPCLSASREYVGEVMRNVDKTRKNGWRMTPESQITSCFGECRSLCPLL